MTRQIKGWHSQAFVWSADIELFLYALITSLRRKWPPSPPPPPLLQHNHPSPPLPPPCRTSTLTMAAPPSPHPALASRAQSAFVRQRIWEGSKVFFLNVVCYPFARICFKRLILWVVALQPALIRTFGWCWSWLLIRSCMTSKAFFLDLGVFLLCENWNLLQYDPWFPGRQKWLWDTTVPLSILWCCFGLVFAGHLLMKDTKFLCSYFSPVLKSLARRNDAECYLCLDVPEEREEFIHLLESRFLFLAADARSTIRLFICFSFFFTSLYEYNHCNVLPHLKDDL